MAEIPPFTVYDVFTVNRGEHVDLVVDNDEHCEIHGCVFFKFKE